MEHYKVHLILFSHFNNTYRIHGHNINNLIQYVKNDFNTAKGNFHNAHSYVFIIIIIYFIQ